MKKNLRFLAWAAAGVVALTLGSCAYDPYYSSTSFGYSSGGFGHGYGYGGSSFNTSFFVSTGDPRWGYDPYCYSYYDYRSHRYYDPYLNGFYPVGYRPPIVYGVPHPHGWRPGSAYCPPPRRVTNVTVVNYTDRASAYRRTNYDWARQVRPMDSRPGGSSFGSNRPDFNGGNNGSRPQWGGGNSQWGGRPDSDRNPGQGGGWGSSRPSTRPAPPSRYNTPVNIEQPPRENFGSRPQLGIPAERPQVQDTPRENNRGNGGFNKFTRPSRGEDQRYRPAPQPQVRETPAPTFSPDSGNGGGFSGRNGGGFSPGRGEGRGRGGDAPGRSGGFRGDGEERGRGR